MIGGNIGCQSALIAGNTAGQQLGLCGVSAASAASAKPIEGLLHTVSWGADTTAATISVYDGSNSSGTLLYQCTLPTTTTPGFHELDIQARAGLFVVISGATTNVFTFTFK